MSEWTRGRLTTWDEGDELVDWNRLGGWSGIVYAAMSIVGWMTWQFGSGTMAISLGKSAAEVSRWYAENQLLIRIALVPWTLALGPLLVFLVATYRRFRSAEGGSGTAALLYLIGAILGGSVYIGIAFLFMWSAAYRAGQVSPEITQFSRDVIMMTGPPLCGSFAVAMVAAGLVIRRRAGFPTWMGTFAIVTGACQLLYVAGGFTDTGVFNPQYGLIGALIPYGSHFAWILAISLLMLKQPRTRLTHRGPVSTHSAV